MEELSRTFRQGLGEKRGPSAFHVVPFFDIIASAQAVGESTPSTLRNGADTRTRGTESATVTNRHDSPLEHRLRDAAVHFSQPSRKGPSCRVERHRRGTQPLVVLFRISGHLEAAQNLCVVIIRALGKNEHAWYDRGWNWTTSASKTVFKSKPCHVARSNPELSKFRRRPSNEAVFKEEDNVCGGSPLLGEMVRKGVVVSPNVVLLRNNSCVCWRADVPLSTL